MKRSALILILASGAAGCAAKATAQSVAAPSATATDSLIVTTSPYYEIHAPRNADITAARQELDFAVARFSEYFDTPRYIAVMLFRNTQEMSKADLTAIHARKVPHLSWFMGGMEPSRLEGMRALSHEACHIMFNQRMRIRTGWTPSPVAPKPEDTKYGFAGMPDWMDEAAAVLCEFPALQQQRRELLRKSTLIPLETLFAIEHPSMPQVRKMLSQAQAGTSAVTIGGPPAEKPVVEPLLFYAQALSVAEFIVTRGGPTAIREIADALGDGLSMSEALKRVPALPQTIAEFEAAWRATVR